jgi:aspartyl-tRNA(Asn)/glutamyl-tRNA(Gln) amidotransferase subunit A
VAGGFRYPVPDAGKRRWRIGVPKGATDGIQAEVAANFTAALDSLRGVAEVVPDVAVPDLPFGVVVGTIIAAEGASAFDDLLESGRLRDLTAPEDRIGAYPALAISARDYLRAMRVRRLMARVYDDFLRPFDAVATPTRTTVSSPLDKPFRDAYPDVKGGVSLIGSSNVVGVPGISVPNGFGLNGLPTGLSFVTRAFDELTLVWLARAYQSRTDWHARRPPLP